MYLKYEEPLMKYFVDMYFIASDISTYFPRNIWSILVAHVAVLFLADISYMGKPKAIQKLLVCIRNYLEIIYLSDCINIVK